MTGKDMSDRLNQVMEEAVSAVEKIENAHHTEGVAVEGGAPEEAARTVTADVDALKDQLLRLAADFDNFRKRARKEREDLRTSANEQLLLDILPVLDNLDRAMGAAADRSDPIVQGVQMVAKQFLDVLGRYGAKPIDTVGQPFDPEVHEALGQSPSDAPPGTVLQETQKGYKLHDRLLRPAQVIVAGARPEESAH